MSNPQNNSNEEIMTESTAIDKKQPTKKVKAAKPAKLSKTEKQAKMDKAKAEKQAKSEKAKADKLAKSEKAKADKQAKSEKTKADKQAKSEKAKADKQAKSEKAKADKQAKSEKAKAKKEKPQKIKAAKTKTAKDTQKETTSTEINGVKEKSEEEIINPTKKPDNKKTINKKEKKSSSKEENKKASDKKPQDKNTKAKKDSVKKNTTEKKAPKEKWNIKHLGGYLFAKMLRGGASELQANAEEVNKLNVFPVPDGDTGDNMAMTIESGVASLDNIDTDDLAEVLRVASRGMLLGARGNSGVILSQFFAGMAKGLENVETADAKKLAHALEIGVEQAYKSVMTPTEGTILTVAREAVEYAVKRVNSKSTVQSLFSDLVNEMNSSLARTPEILPILNEAGVVDSGGAGLLYIIDGLNRVLNGEDVEENESSLLPSTKNVSANNGSFGPDSVMDYGYCTELLVQLMNKKLVDNPFDLDSLKLYLASYGDSIVAFQTESIVKIHVHTLRPDKIMRYMLKFGDFISVKVENMSLQHTELEAEKEEEPTPKKKYGIVAVSNGDGISNLFRELGADQIVEGGQTNNPSTNDFIDSFEKINAENIFVFPNNGNIIMAASQAAEIYENAKVYVIPTRSIGAGYVSLSSMSFDSAEPDELVAEAEEAIGRIVAAYISPAVRDVDMNGVHVTEGDTMGIINKEIVISGPDKMVSTYGLIDIMLADGDKFMITVFHGKDATIEERDRLAEYMLQTYPHIEAYYVDGGQEIYPFLFVAE